MMDMHRLAQRLLHMLQPARVRRVDDSGPVQRHQVDLGPKGPAGALRIFENLPVVGLFGVASHPPLSSELFVAFLEGDPSKGVVVGSNHQPSRLKNLGEGDAALYDVRGAYVWLTPDGINIDAAGKRVRVQNAPQIECTGDVVAYVDGAPISLKALHDAYNAHRHTGVQTGGGATGATDHPVP